jgi:hypothetical protein
MGKPRRPSKRQRRRAREASHDLRSRYSEADLPFLNGIGRRYRRPLPRAGRRGSIGMVIWTRGLGLNGLSIATAHLPRARRDGRRRRVRW